MANIASVTYGATSSNLRSLHNGVFVPRVSYGLRIWGSALRKKTVCKLLLKVQRTYASKIAKSFRTSGNKEIISLARITPIDDYLKILYNFKLKSENSTQLYINNLVETDIRDACKKANLRLFNETKLTFEYSSYDHFPNNVPYVLTQVLTGHGKHNSFISKLNREITPFCGHSTCTDRETTNHIIFKCPRYSTGRQALCEVCRQERIPFENTKCLIDNKYTLTAFIKFLLTTKLRFGSTED